MDSVYIKRSFAQMALGIFSVWVLLALLACAPVVDPNDPKKPKDPSQTDPADPSDPTTPADPTKPPVTPPVVPPVTPPPTLPPVALVNALWEKPNPIEGPKWTTYAFGIVRDYGANLLAGTTDVTNFCPAYNTLNANQKLSFWVYLVSAMTKFESSFDPTNRYKESTMGTDPITKEPVYSEGLLQLSYQDGSNYKYCNEFDWAKDKLLSRTDPKKTILDPYKNLKCGIRIMNQIMASHHAIAFGSGHYWSVLKTTSKYNKVKEIQALTNQVLFCRK